MSDPRELDDVRRELQRLGYLSHRVERFLLQDALVPRDPWRGLPRLAAKVGLLAGSVVAAASALALAAANGSLRTAPGDLLVLFLHLVLPAALGSALAFVAVVAAFAGVSKAFPRRSQGFLRLSVALGATALLLGVGVGYGGELVADLPRLERALGAALLPLAAAAVAKLVADGLLAFGIRMTHRAPRERMVRRRTVTAVVAGCVVVLGLLALLVPRRPRAAAPPALPSAPGERVALVGIDGVLADELDYLLARGELPALARLAGPQGIAAAYRRDPGVSPAELWTTIATGLPGSAHGVVAFDSFRPAGAATPLARLGPWRPWFASVEAPIGLAEHRPLLASRRRAPFFWELAARGGAPVAAIDWWATYPAEPLTGLVVAHGAWNLLASDAPGAVAPEARRAEVEALARTVDGGPSTAVLDAALPEAERDRALERAVLPDRLSLALAGQEAGGGARALAVYLPALDLLAADWGGGPEPFAELVRIELVAADRLVGALSGFGTVVVVVDPGRRGGEQGRI
ncbi:MAG TPA: alkaline phosphatase family protein, partial [Thermoanaerobaculia bacterium]|nr:alkaline phosphatase family protein [Thermoanaerobaculia bacterium]